ncbi:MAG: endonuclease/exonuclease/phosphatase family protein [Wenzhouxiangellaceae bacterium]|nr:endonuclease/exonuclease/phosphatase family protein [Wenzhouxiangellaceae bacterium]
MQTLNLLSFNIQAGSSTTRYRQYVTRSWRQVLPNNQRVTNLDAISELVSGYDIVGLQEVDCGSLRSGFVNQAKYLATHAGFPWWTHQANRKVGVIAHAGNGVLSRFTPSRVDEHRLPGAIPGRGALMMKFGEGENALWIVVLHLALGRRARMQQLSYVAHLVAQHKNVIIMGDLNAVPNSHEVEKFCEHAGVALPAAPPNTFPSWEPRRAIDHIMISPSIEVLEVAALDSQLSDHLALTTRIRLPDGLSLQRHVSGDEKQENAEQPGQAG